MFRKIERPSVKTVISTAASVAATAMLVRSMSRDLIPKEINEYIHTKFNTFLSTFTNEITMTINEYDGLNKNQLFYAAEIYLATVTSPVTKSFCVSLPEKETKINVKIGKNEDITDKFCGFELTWRTVSKETDVARRNYIHGGLVKSEVKYLVLTFHKKHKSKVVDEYLPYVLERSKALKEEKKTMKLHTLHYDNMHGYDPWEAAVVLDHPSTFETLAMDDELKNMIVDDLNRFLERKELYRKVGKAWKRGYLLFGPPGTGKSSLIAAMANYLNFHIYDLDLAEINSNSDLTKILMSTSNRSILVVEDIDASIDLSDRNNKETKPSFDSFGLLNFIDGLWSSCGDERIVIFTTNHKEKLDPALLRPGRMDVHIHMSYCTPCGFKKLVSNYLGITNPHPLALEAERLITLAKVTPAEVGEQLLKSDDAGIALGGLIEFLKGKMENERVKEESLKLTKSKVVLRLEEEESRNEE
ncbi:hypothetical protein RD792_016330 [Penstemon davidsonii]|uniref:AAA+ ATPase domain-containing protein n=1 Tax=Penstemon davidsonii TaxID=160366 RepID=A0ABR0CJ59_9LAMI|nr:hypothetical protein RD792_016330 [Penstemon davidsonii]